MKAKDIILEKDINEDDCAVCQLHTKAYDVLKVCCPHCNGEVDYDSLFGIDVTVVGEGNYYSEDQIIEKMGTFKCTHCDNEIGIKLIPIRYNANHDIYYTGGKSYVFDQKIELTPEMNRLIEDFTTRIQAGENLEAWNLKHWLRGEMESEVARILYEKGLKF